MRRLRLGIQMTDWNTLVGMFRLEKGVMTSIAEIVYKEVHVEDMRKFQRSNVSQISGISMAVVQEERMLKRASR
jgi:hypothetical protein